MNLNLKNSIRDQPTETLASLNLNGLFL